MDNTVYISLDVETDGIVPGISSLLSIGAVAYNNKGEEISVFNINLRPLDDASPDKKTMEWWQKFPEQYKLATIDQCLPKEALLQMGFWLQSVSPEEEPVLIGFPVPFDWSWINYYNTRFGTKQFFFTGIDIKTLAYATGRFDNFLRGTRKAKLPVEWLTENENAHSALDDARHQGHIFFQIAKELKLPL